MGIAVAIVCPAALRDRRDPAQHRVAGGGREDGRQHVHTDAGYHHEDAQHEGLHADHHECRDEDRRPDADQRRQIEHIRNPEPHQWKKRFTPRVMDYFMERYGDLITRYGYES